MIGWKGEEEWIVRRVVVVVVRRFVGFLFFLWRIVAQ
jgi:hypothetical protein